jgi:hypothetical protein
LSKPRVRSSSAHPRCKLSQTLVWAILATITLPVLLGSPAEAHRAGKAIPSIRVESQPADSSGSLTHEITVTISDADSPNPVSGAEVTVEASMSIPHSMHTLPIPLVEEGSSGIYKGRLRYPMPADWTLKVTVKGPNVQEATAELPVSVTLTSPPSNQAPIDDAKGQSSTGRPVVTISGRLSGSDVVPIASLFAHAVFAAIWAISTLVLVLVAHPKTSQWFSPDVRRAVLKKRSPIRLAAVAGGVLLVATGVSNGFVAAPFRLVPTFSSVKAAMQYPFGSLYLLVLAGKIVVLVALIIVNRVTAPSDVEATAGREAAQARFALAADLLLFPLLLILITLLKYLHVLVHVSLAAQ